MTKLKKHLVLLAAVSLIALPTITLADESADTHTGTVDFELVESTVESSTTEPTETTDSSTEPSTSDTDTSSSEPEPSSSSGTNTSTSDSKKAGVPGGNQSNGQSNKYGMTLPKTGEVVNFFAAFLGAILLGIGGLLLFKRKKGGDV